MSETKTISPQELKQLYEQDSSIEVLDVRTPAEYREVHAPFVKNVPLNKLDPKSIMQSRNGNSDKPLYLICKSGTRSETALKKFQSMGFDNVAVVEGGTEAWTNAGYEVERGKKTISIERQVRIAAGTLVFAGVLLGVYANPYFLIIPGFVGAGLVFAGITNTCGMAMLLAAMPWNK